VRAIIGPNGPPVYRIYSCYCTVVPPKSAVAIDDISEFQLTRPWLPTMSMRGRPEPLTI
jgi:hypothetical protein